MEKSTTMTLVALVLVAEDLVLVVEDLVLVVEDGLAEIREREVKVALGKCSLSCNVNKKVKVSAVKVLKS